MPKLPFKRKADDESLNAYIPTQMVDYTALPPIDEDSALAKFRRLPLMTRLGVIVLPLLLIGSAAWGVWAFLNAPEPVVAAPPPPAVTLTDARVVSRDAIAVEGSVEHIAEGTPASARLVAGEREIAWADASSGLGVISNGRVNLRLTKAEDAAALKPNVAYSVEVVIGIAPDLLTERVDLMVPDLLREVFFGAEPAAVAPTATPRPTATPAPPEPTPAPVVETGPPTIGILRDATLLISPTLGSAVVIDVDAGDRFAPLARSDDSRWFLLEQEGKVGWLSSEHAAIEPARAAEIASIRPAESGVNAGPLTATVFNGGNIRYRPSVQTGTVLGQLHARQTITVTGKTADGEWIHVVAPEAEGWVSVTLLTIDDSTLARAPVIP
jgi:hypothetical protein